MTAIPAHLADMADALASADGIRIEKIYTRAIPACHAVNREDFEHLYASMWRNRYNPKGVEALYLADTEGLALHELKEGMRADGIDPDKEDILIFRALVRLIKVLDLTEPHTLKKLGLTEKDLVAKWKRRKVRIRTQNLGWLVSIGTGGFSAIKYPTATSAPPEGTDLVVFRTQVRTPDSVTPLSPSALTAWP